MLDARRQWDERFNVLKEKKTQQQHCKQKILYLATLTFKNEGKIKTFPEEQKLREFVTTSPALQKVLKEILHVEMKQH